MQGTNATEGWRVKVRAALIGTALGIGLHILNGAVGVTPTLHRVQGNVVAHVVVPTVVSAKGVR